MWAFAEQYNWWWWWYKDTYFNRIENILLGMCVCVCALVYLFLVTTYNWGVNVSWPSEVKKWIQVYIVLLLLLRWLMNYFISFSLCVSRYTWFLPALWDETSTCRHRDSGCDPIFTIRCPRSKWTSYCLTLSYCRFETQLKVQIIHVLRCTRIKSMSVRIRLSFLINY